MSFLLEVIQNSSSTMNQFEKTEKEDNSVINAIVRVIHLKIYYK